MAHLGVIGTKIQNSSASSVSITLTAAAPVGSTILVGIAWESAAGSVPTISGVTDTGGNSYSTTPTVSANAATTVAVAVLRTRVTTALDIGNTITVTISGGTRGRWAMQADCFDDVDASPLDKTATSTPGSSGSLTSGVTAATVQAQELVYAVFGFGSGRTVGIPGDWTGGSKVETSAGSGDRALQIVHKYVHATGIQEATLTIAPSSTYAGVIATLKFTPTEPPEARISQVKLLAPIPGDALVARVAQVRLIVPQAVLGEIRVSQVRLRAPAKAGQPPYSGIKAARDGNVWDATIQTPEGT